MLFFRWSLRQTFENSFSGTSIFCLILSFKIENGSFLEERWIKWLNVTIKVQMDSLVYKDLIDTKWVNNNYVHIGANKNNINFIFKEFIYKL